VETLDRASRPETPVEEPSVPPSQRAARRRGVLAVVACLFVGWTLPWLTQRLHADAVLPVVILVGTASLLRGGRTLLDRLMLATLLLLGLVSAAGLVFSFWPWGLAPAPVGRAALLGLVLVAAAARRRPRLPLRMGWSDALVWAGGLAPTVFLWSGFWGKDAAHRLAMVIGAEDLARHFTVFDTIRAAGGYLPFHREAAARTVNPGLIDYPQAAHLLSALLDNFARSSTTLGDGFVAFDHYLAWCLVGYGILALSLVWGTRWVAGAALRGWRLMAAVSVISGCTGGGYLVSLVDRGYPSEALGLALLTMVLALAARPLKRPREQALLLAAGLIGLGFTYYFFLPLGCAAVLAWAVIYRGSRWRAPWLRARWSALTIAVGAAPLVVFWPTLSVLGGVSVTAALLPDVGIPQLDRRVITALCALVLLGTVTRVGRRNPVWRSVATQLVLASGIAAAIAAYQLAQTGGISYYFEKALHGALVVGFLGLGAVGLLVPADPFGWVLRGRARWLTGFALPALTSVLAAALAYGMLAPAKLITTHPSKKGGTAEPDAGVSRGRAFHGDALSRPNDAIAAVRTYRRYPNGEDGTVTLVVTTYRLYVPSLFLAGFRRQGGEASLPVGGLNGGKGIQTLEHVAEVSPKPVRFVVARPDLVAGLREIAARRPELRLQVVVVPERDAPPPPKKTG
jgi:hypothetical protein